MAAVDHEVVRFETLVADQTIIALSRVASAAGVVRSRLRHSSEPASEQEDDE
jgi:hypothetical protein